jgi:AhpD family alkylhydroperoxidase
MQKFTKRRYEGFGQFRADLRLLWGRRREVRGILRGQGISPDFRERLILAVTAVNRCRFCTFAHSRAALREGVSRDEVNGLLAGTFDGVPDTERTAVLYAQHWAETGGQPEPGAAQRVSSEYGPETASRIDTTLRFINFCNLFGNTGDWVLHTVSFGLVGSR